MEDSARRPAHVNKQRVMGCLVWSGFLPADGAVEHAHDEHGEGEVPGVTHGDEHHVAVIR